MMFLDNFVFVSIDIDQRNVVWKGTSVFRVLLGVNDGKSTNQTGIMFLQCKVLIPKDVEQVFIVPFNIEPIVTKVFPFHCLKYEIEK